MRIAALLVSSSLLALALASPACTQGGTTTGTSSTSGSGGMGGAGGACPMGPQAIFELSVSAADGPVPADTTIDVSWSAGMEPEFVLDHQDTWKTIDASNLICDVDPQKPPPTDLPTLVCHLWTTGATQVTVHAKGYTPFDATFSPTVSDRCKGPIPTPIAVKLERPAPDAG